MRKVDYEDPQTLELRILASIKKLSRGLDLLVKLQLEILSHRSMLRNQIIAYNGLHGESGCDDLMSAILKDEALPYEEIKAMFDYDEFEFRRGLERLQARDMMRD